MIPRKNGYDFRNQHPRKPPGTKFHKNRTTFSFWSLFGGPTPKKHKFFLTKKVRTKILTLFLYSEPSITIAYQISAKSDDIWKLAKKYLKSMQKF